MTQRNSGRSFFATLPGMFTGLASLIGAISALYVALYQGPRSAESQPPGDIVAIDASAGKVQDTRTDTPKTLEGSAQRAQPARETKQDPRRLVASQSADDPRWVVDATDVKQAPAAAHGIAGAWRFSEAWDHETSICDVGGVYQFEQIGSEFGGQYSQASECAGSTIGIVTDGEISGYDVSFVVPADNVTCVYEGALSGRPANRMEGTAVCGDGENFVMGHWSAYRDIGR